jgi:hypothetical protein
MNNKSVFNKRPEASAPQEKWVEYANDLEEVCRRLAGSNCQQANTIKKKSTRITRLRKDIALKDRAIRNYKAEAAELNQEIYNFTNSICYCLYKLLGSFSKRPPSPAAAPIR